MSEDIVLSVRGLRKRFGPHTVLDGVDFSVRRGEIVGVIGPGGVGKSVLFKICCGLLSPDQGEVYVLKQNFQKLSPVDQQTLRERIGLAFQNFALFDFMTVGENIAFPMRQRGGASEAKIMDKVRQRLAEVDLPGAIDQMPSELSGGMKKRVGLARANINDPELIFFDDPTAGLDPVTSSKIFNLVKRTRDDHGTTCVMISHDIDRMRAACDRWVLLLDGRVHWQGGLTDAEHSEDPVVQDFFRSKTELSY